MKARIASITDLGVTMREDGTEMLRSKVAVQVGQVIRTVYTELEKPKIWWPSDLSDTWRRIEEKKIAAATLNVEIVP